MAGPETLPTKQRLPSNRPIRRSPSPCLLAIEKRDYVDSLGHAWQSIVIRDATCETDGKLLELCSRCGQMKQTATPKGEHQYKTYPVAATCMNPGYTVRECSVCGDRHIEDIISVLPHNQIIRLK